MLFLLFQLGQDRYAIEAQQAVEVVPLLELKRIPHAPAGVAGIFNYRGRPVPAIDLCALTLGRPAREQLSTRIIILRHVDAQGRPQLVGVIAERATDLLRKEVSAGAPPLTRAPNLVTQPARPPGPRAAGQHRGPNPACSDTAHRAADTSHLTPDTFLGPVMMDEKGFLQLVRPDHLLTEPVREALFAQCAAQIYSAESEPL